MILILIKRLYFTHLKQFFTSLIKLLFDLIIKFSSKFLKLILFTIIKIKSLTKKLFSFIYRVYKRIRIRLVIISSFQIKIQLRYKVIEESEARSKFI